MNPLIDKPIHPIIRFGKQLTRDEIYAAVVSVVLTSLAYFVISTFFNLTTGMLAIILPFISPVLEKPGLILHYIKEGFLNFKKNGGSLYKHIKIALCDGRALSTVRADILFHDPGYALLMMLGILVFDPQTTIAVGFLSLLSFIGGLVIATILEVLYAEFTYIKHCKKLISKGYTREKYYEARYLITANNIPNLQSNIVFNDLKTYFNLPDVFYREYYDWYDIETEKMEFNGREFSARYRERTSSEGGYDVKFGPTKSTKQIIYTRSGELDKNGSTLFRCYFIEKDKFSIIYENNNTKSLSLNFSRMVARHPDGLFISIDKLNDEKTKNMYWIEVKVHPKNLNMLIKANEYIAMMFPVQGTTHNKSHIVNKFMA